MFDTYAGHSSPDANDSFLTPYEEGNVGTLTHCDPRRDVCHCSLSCRLSQFAFLAIGFCSVPEIQAWRRAFARMGLKPTQYRCAAESLLRRFRKEGALPRLHPLVNLCNAVSLAFAIPVAVFDISKITGALEVRYAAGDEDYLTFSGEVEHPAVHEVIFFDAAGQAHARRWSNRQSGLSAVRNPTTAALIVAGGDARLGPIRHAPTHHGPRR